MGFAVAVFVLALIYLFLIFPGKRNGETFPAKFYAHRGLFHCGIEENSLPAFRAAALNGIGVELDVQYTLDGKIVVFHDDSLKRMCGVDKKICELTYKELQSLNLGSSQEKIPLFSEVLEVLGGVPLICEIKMQEGFYNTRICPVVYEMLKGYSGPYCVESFNPMLVRWFKKNAPEVLRGQLAEDEMKNKRNVTNFLLKRLFVNALSRPQFIAYRYGDNPFELRLIRKFTKALIVTWTVHGQEEVKKAINSYDAVIFERI